MKMLHTYGDTPQRECLCKDKCLHAGAIDQCKGLPSVLAEQPAQQEPAKASDELLLIESVLKGYPSSFAQADALRAVKVLLAAAPQPAPVQQEPDAIVTSLTAGPDGVARSGLDRELPLMAGVYLTPQPAQRKPLPEWIAVSERLPAEEDGEVLVRMRDGRCEIAWATYWHGASNAFAQWTFRDPDEDEAPTHWMHIPTAEAATA